MRMVTFEVWYLNWRVPEATGLLLGVPGAQPDLSWYECRGKVRVKGQNDAYVRLQNLSRRQMSAIPGRSFSVGDMLRSVDPGRDDGAFLLCLPAGWREVQPSGD